MLPQPLWDSRINVIAILSYLTVIPGLLFFIEMSRGILRRFLQILLLAELPICAAGVGAVLFTKSPYRFIHYSNVLVVFIRSPCRARDFHSRYGEEIRNPAPQDFYDRLSRCGISSFPIGSGSWNTGSPITIELPFQPWGVKIDLGFHGSRDLSQR
jgi:hypothetical protein